MAMAARKQPESGAAEVGPPAAGSLGQAGGPEVRRQTGGRVFVARETFSWTDADGVPLIAHAGQTRVREGHPLLAGREHLFDPVEGQVHYDVEQATAAPGEKRGRS